MYQHLDQYSDFNYQPPVSIHDVTADMCVQLGISNLAQDVGLMNQSRDIPSLQRYTPSAGNQLNSTSHYVRDGSIQVGQLELSNMRHMKQEPATAMPVGKAGTASHSGSGKKTMKSRRKNSKKNKGLGLFSGKVCDLVESKRRTSYNEVAEELIKELNKGDEKIDGKNIKRRVYDALNVLAAMDIISKKKKEITWNGFPTCNPAGGANSRLQFERTEKKKEFLLNLKKKLEMYKILIERNRHIDFSPEHKIYLPFIAVETDNLACVDCDIAEDKTTYLFRFDKNFELLEEVDVLERMKETLQIVAAPLTNSLYPSPMTNSSHTLTSPHEINF